MRFPSFIEILELCQRHVSLVKVPDPDHVRQVVLGVEISAKELPVPIALMDYEPDWFGVIEYMRAHKSGGVLQVGAGRRIFC